MWAEPDGEHRPGKQRPGDRALLAAVQVDLDTPAGVEQALQELTSISLRGSWP